MRTVAQLADELCNAQDAATRLMRQLTGALIAESIVPETDYTSVVELVEDATKKLKIAAVLFR